MERVSTIIDPNNGKPFVHANGKPRPRLMEAMLAAAAARGNSQHRAKASYDAARDTSEYQAHWANSDALDADSANSLVVRHKLMRRSRYEAGSNGIYAGVMATHVNMLIGVGPTLRMLTTNRNFNQLVERRFYQWAQKVDLVRKLRCMAHARIQDGEAFAILQTNPEIDDEVKLDLTLIEAEQVQTPFMRPLEPGQVDGIHFDKFGNVLWYDVLPEHPGSANWRAMTMEAIPVPRRAMLHWFKAERPGQHRGIPAMTSTLNVGASSRRWREATLSAAEIVADFTLFLKTQQAPEAMTTTSPFEELHIPKRTMTTLPEGWEPFQPKAEQPTAQYEAFNRTLVSEMARPISMPYNAVSCDSSTYSFASGKLDTLCYRAELNVERQECNGVALDRIFAEWFLEFTLIRNRRFVPAHQWDWPAHPIIDVESESRATDTQLKNGTTTLREAYTAQGRDYEDELAVMAEDWFGEASEESIKLARTINLLRSVPKDALPFVAAAIGVAIPQAQETAA